MINLFINYYEDKNPIRQKEIYECLLRNCALPYLNVIILESQERLTYNFYFSKINSITNRDDINIIANSDIYFDETILYAEKYLNKKQCYALCRYDVLKGGKVRFFNRNDSQDVWVFRGNVRCNNANFALGTPGCDNRIAHELIKAGYQVTNPSRTIKTYHLHSSNIRNYVNFAKNPNAVPGPYRQVEVSALL